MCGRFSLIATKTQINQQFQVNSSDNLEISRYNIAPSQQVMAVRSTDTGRKVSWMKWGLVPSWVKDLSSWKGNLINARSETISQKPSFKSGFQKRPCLIPASGFYEWRDRQPYYFHQDKPLFAFAGIWEIWSDPDSEEEIISCTILTTKAQGIIESIHHRMPVLLSEDNYGSWLGTVDMRKELLSGYSSIVPSLKMYPVHKTVNSPRNDSKECIQPLSE